MALSFLQSAPQTADLTTYTFASQNLGSEDAGRYIFVGVACRKGNTSTTTASVTVGGVSCTEVISVVNSASNTCFSGLYLAAVPTGTTGDVVVTLNNQHLRCVIHLWRVDDLSSATPFDTASSGAANPSLNLDIPADGFAIGCGGVAGAATCAWTGLTERNDQQVEGVYATTAASDELAAETNRTITITYSGGTGSPTGVSASWAFGAPVGGGFQSAWARNSNVVIH